MWSWIREKPTIVALQACHPDGLTDWLCVERQGYPEAGGSQGTPCCINGDGWHAKDGRSGMSHGSISRNAMHDIRGQALVETALVLPVILLLLMAIIDFGLLFNNYIVLSNASREGARQAAVGATDAQIVATIDSLTGTLDDSKRSVSISPALSLRKHGVQVTVTVHYESELVTPVIRVFFPGGKADLNVQTVMRVE